MLNDNEDGTFSIKGNFVPNQPRYSTAVVISRGPLDPNEPPMAEARNNRSQSEHITTRPSVGDIQNDGAGESHEGGVQRGKAPAEPFTILSSGKAVISDIVQPATMASKPEKVDGVVSISPDLTMATDLRAYKEWPGQSWTLTVYSL